ncbi:hypothetical protein AB9K26_13230 [Psychroserpens sp. XS_ASV72]|uniref:hypothetical protein n=1 Tax=Psychroserpens sp. XS_ASV72 TaxID=3241293 RepID=UPI003512AEA3
MKKVLTILVFVLVPVLSFAQENTSDIKGNDNTAETVIENSIEVKETKNTTNNATSAVKAQVIKLNRKKSTEIISIKAYRKSLHIKVKEVVVC